ncbi:MAG: hypothetical protein HY049_12750 [Acidobacteria bacterium]|nr:hypothetical protein [Acidobacteriota bacterium]
MTRKLGEVLTDDGRITEAQLEKALKAQLIFGGHLGTSLIELGYVDEETLGETLAHAFNVPYASYDVLQNVPYSVIRAIPAKLVEKYKVVPIRMDGKVLQLAMMDPKNLMALDEISFVTGYKIDPWVAPEIRIFQVLEKYYNIPRSQRYITLARELSRLRSRGEKIRPPGAPAPPPGGSDPHEPDPGIAVMIERPPTVATPPSSSPAAAAPEAHPRGPADPWEKYGYGKSWREFADAMEKKGPPGTAVSAAVPEPAPPPRSTGPGASPELELVEAAKRLAACTTPDEVAETALAFAGRFFVRRAFFVLRGDSAVGWDGSGEGLSPGRIKGMNVELVRDSLFSLIDDGRPHYLGPVPPLPSIRRFYQDLALSMPKSAFLLPIQIKDKTASVLYGDGGDEDDLRTLDVQAFERLGQKASLALQMLILRGKILGR